MSLTIETKDLELVTQSLAAHLPGGLLWEGALIPGTNINALLKGLSGLLLDTEVFNQIYSTEFIPSGEGTSFLEDWERIVEIPGDGCFPGPAEPDRTVRRLHVLVKLASLGVQTADDFEALATSLGFPTVTVKSGIDEGIAEPEGQFTIFVRFPFTGNKFPLKFPIPFGTDEFGIIQCLFTKLAPDNCKVLYGFLP
jgi:hypothetical protein